MHRKWSLISFAILSIVALCVWVAFAFAVDPYTASVGQFILFYVDVFVAVAGIITLAGYGTRYLKSGKRSVPSFLTCFRQGILAGVYVSGLLVFQSQRLLTITTALVYLAALTCIEFFAASFTEPYVPLSKRTDTSDYESK